jgi:hypothetical protein
MKNKKIVTLSFLSYVLAMPVMAQQPAVPPVPVMPAAPSSEAAPTFPVIPSTPPPGDIMGAGSGNAPAIPVFDPSQPFNPASPLAAQPIQPIRPQNVPNPPPSAQQGAATLPLPEDQEMFDFFQPGYQMDEMPKQEAAPAPEPAIEIAPPKKDSGAGKKLPLVRFNYKSQHLPETIYKKQYNTHNKHLPKAYYPEDYDQLAFSAAAANNLNAVRALLNAGRDIEMRNEHGETLVMVATRHGSRDVLRYLLAKGADPYGAEPLAVSRRDGQAFYALKAVE